MASTEATTCHWVTQSTALMWYSLCDSAMEEALYENTSLRQFARPVAGQTETTQLNFRHLLEKHGLCPRLLETVAKAPAAKIAAYESVVIVSVIHANHPSRTRPECAV